MKDNNDLIEDITEHLDQSVETLDPEILSQIRAARYNALEQKRSGFMQWALPAGGIAVAAVVIFVAVNFYTGSDKISIPQDKIVETTTNETESGKEETLPEVNKEAEIQHDQIELVEILSSDQQLDLFENLEFYAWLAENENISG